VKNLVYIGLSYCSTFIELVNSGRFDRHYGIDPLEKYADLHKRLNEIPNVEVMTAAAWTHDGEIEFTLSGGSDLGTSSISKGNSLDFPYRSHENLHNGKVVKVRSVNYPAYLQSKGIEQIDTLITDAQGADLTILKTFEAYLRSQKIGSITLELEDARKGKIYPDLPDNTVQSAAEYLKQFGYILVGSSHGIVTRGEFHDFSDDRWWADYLFEIAP